MATEEIKSDIKSNSIDKALRRFADMLIQRMEVMTKDWSQGWTGSSVFGLPQNMTGRTYEGSNAFLLQMHSAMNHYHAPVYMTFLQAKNEGIKINKGEPAIPVFKWGLSIKDGNGKKLTENDYRNLSDEEQSKCKIHPYLRVFAEWNIDQTNLAEANKEKYDALIARFENKPVDGYTGDMYVNEALDRMMQRQEWVCPIQYDKEEPGAYYSVSKDIIVLPQKSQFHLHPDNLEESFKDGQEYYGTALHEMAHSTGHESRLNRLKASAFGSSEYAKEELVAELTSAMVGNALGFDRRISDNNAAYLKNWIKVLRQEPKFIVTVMADVNKASRMVIEHIDQQRISLDEKPLLQGRLDGEDEKNNNAQQLEKVKSTLQQSAGTSDSMEGRNINTVREQNNGRKQSAKPGNTEETSVRDKRIDEKQDTAIENRTASEDEKERIQKEVRDINEKQEEEKKKSRNEEKQMSAKAITHASILVAALAQACKQEGVWMNKNCKENASFLHSKTPISPYNSLMMNLESDLKGYKTNVYTYYHSAQENGIAIKHGERALPFNWTKWNYQNIFKSDDIIGKSAYDALQEADKNIYEKHASRLTQHVFNIDQTTFPDKDNKSYSALLPESDVKQENALQHSVSSPLSQLKDLKAKHPDALILFRNGDFYETYNEDAKKAGKILGITVTHPKNGDMQNTARFPYHALDTYLPKLVRAGERVAICDRLEDPKLTKSTQVAKSILDKAYGTAREVAKVSGMKYESVKLLQAARYDKQEDKLVVSVLKSGTIGNETMAAIQKANDIYKAVVASLGVETRLDRSGRNGFVPEDDMKYDKLIQELASGVLMARQGIPATLSKESHALVPFWKREIQENPKFLGIVERDVNNAVETIDNLMAKRKVDYEAIRGQLPLKKELDSSKSYSILSQLVELPSKRSKEFILIKDSLNKQADILLPEGAALTANNGKAGYRSDKITAALEKEGIDQVHYYNASGTSGLNQSNEYFRNREITLCKMNRDKLIVQQQIDVSKEANKGNQVDILKFQAIKDDKGRYAFYIKPKGEPSFSVYPSKDHMDAFFKVMNTPEQKAIHDSLSRKWYAIATHRPEIKVDIITPPKVDVDMNRIVRPTITSSAQDYKQKIVIATIDGKRQVAPVSKQQWNRMWLADDMAEYKKAVAAVVFEPLLKKAVAQERPENIEEVPAKVQSEAHQEITSRGLKI